jgi:hypothetical protein
MLISWMSVDREMAMKGSFLAFAVVAAVALVVSPALGKEIKTKKKKGTADTVTQAQTPTPAGPKIEAGWPEITTNTPKLVLVGYKLDGSTLIIKFRNLSKKNAIRVKYHAKWKKDWNGRMVDDSTADGLYVRLKKGGDFPSRYAREPRA